MPPDLEARAFGARVSASGAIKYLPQKNPPQQNPPYGPARAEFAIHDQCRKSDFPREKCLAML